VPDCSGLFVSKLSEERRNHKLASNQQPSRLIVTPPATPQLPASPAIRDSAARRITQTVLSTSMVLGADFVTTSMPYGMALKAEALVRRPLFSDLLLKSEWVGAYKRSWGVLKYGFYPTFLVEVAATETTKQFASPKIAQYSDTIMPAIIGAGTAPAVSFAAINARFNLQFDILHVLKTQGFKGVSRLTGAPGIIGIREAICYKALHHDTTAFAKRIANASSNSHIMSSLLKNKDGNPSPVARIIASTPDAAGLLLTQPLTMLAVNAGIHKYAKQQHPNVAEKPTIASPVALLKWQLGFWQEICSSIICEGKKHGLSQRLSFAPGIAARTLSLFGTLGVFKYAMEPSKQLVAETITHRKS
jgi:hypothetical protein